MAWIKGAENGEFCIMNSENSEIAGFWWDILSHFKRRGGEQNETKWLIYECSHFCVLFSAFGSRGPSPAALFVRAILTI